MEEPFTLDICYDGKSQQLAGCLILLEYFYKVRVEINGTRVYFEPDDKDHYHATISHPESGFSDQQLINAVADRLSPVLQCCFY